jgi:hypothetical protein
MRLKSLILSLVTLSFLVSSILVSAYAQRPKEHRVTAYPAKTYYLKKGLRDRGPLKDWVVEFHTDQDSRAHMVTSHDGHANEVLRASTVTANEVRNGKLIVRVITGFQARQLHSYGGSLQEFARTLKVQYLTRRGLRG